MDSVDHSEFLQSWFDLSKSDYAKVIFCDLYHSPEEGAVGCRFQITDNVHEDPCDYIGLFRVGYESLEQCITSKMLCETECEEDGKQLRCIFESEELPEIDDGFYQFLYITRDNEVCGASMPFEIKKIAADEASSDEDIVAEKGEEDINDFLVVRSNLVEKNRSLKAMVEEYRSQNEALEAELKNVKDDKEKEVKEKENIIENLHQEILCLGQQCSIERTKNEVTNGAVLKITKQLESETKLKKRLQAAKIKLSDDKEKLQNLIKEKELELSQEISTIGQDKSILLEQLEDSRTMIRALEDSKLLALREMNDLTKVIGERNKILNELKRQNDDLKCQLDDEIAVNLKQKKLITELKCENLALNLKLEKTVADYHEQKKLFNELKCEHLALVLKFEETTADNHMAKKELQIPCTESKIENDYLLSKPTDITNEVIIESQKHQSVNNEEMNIATVDKDSKIAMQERIIEELKLHISNLMFQDDMKEMGVNNVALDKKFRDSEHSSPASPEHAKLMAEITCYKQEIEVLKKMLTKKSEELEKLTDENCNFQSNKLQMGEVVVDLKSHCAELRSLIADYESSILKLKEECLKKDAVIEYLTKEKTDILKSQKNACETCNEMKARLDIAAELYKKQFVEIKKLKKKVQKLKNASTNVDLLLQSSSTSETLSEDTQLLGAFPQMGCENSSFEKPIRNSDSDTGEHVVGNSVIPQDLMTHGCVSWTPHGKLSGECIPPVPAPHSPAPHMLYPVLTSLLQKEEKDIIADPSETARCDLTALSTSSNMSLDHQTVPCVICQSPVLACSSEPMIQHLEKEHKQQMCPMCGKLFDMNLPYKYFIFHVEDHFHDN